MLQFNNFKYIATNTTTVVSTGTTFIHTIVCPIATTGTVTLEDAAGTDYFVLPIGSIGTFLLDVVCPNGASVVTSAADKVVVTWHQ